MLVTGSRDGSCKLWRVQRTGDASPGLHLLPLMSFSPFGGTAVTALDVLGSYTSRCLVLVGGECGEIQVWAVSPATADREVSVPQPWCHGVNMSVRRLQWAPTDTDKEEGTGLLYKDTPGMRCRRFASCGDDHTVRIFTLQGSPNIL